ncbi:RNA 2',3'-cyclic phosphodiesterase [Streptomyces sp. WAC05374]|uniref:RNA 2',3'-cyclic phosphodiesterase n=1 Tax=Streptomyces sp. WAC05374 TaxID=2487420 RepID=UPI000F86A621|nr:RNA 2',3'-cyclic phosphodiesterase [Streptomyces sp. WAC05374]RST16482.1 RNA 2',3'-cyclic phosphodiesterase [Streptomyces sp. WAC05374]TDF54672.1 RNA 2',3'-cyclic phosphodiesterase [Streptomyces sp. WAC05374]TDF56308.1 RNA 2',3'-cyclic phosphodiesterase [Streptomyces sp. WAC05374]
MHAQHEDPTVRAFIALAPPDDAKEELERALAPAYAAHPRLRWNRIEDWHITLAFLGELPRPAVARLRAPLAELAARHRPLHLTLRGSGHFDERVLWSGIGGDLEGLRLLAAEVRALVQEHGVPFTDRPLNPHLTLARARRDDTSGVVRAAAGLSAFTGRTWQAERLHLVGSNYGRGPGPIHYRDIEAWPFTGCECHQGTPLPRPEDAGR